MTFSFLLVVIVTVTGEVVNLEAIWSEQVEAPTENLMMVTVRFQALVY